MFDESLQSLTVDLLKQRLKLLDTSERPTRKADIAAVIRAHMLSPRCRDYFQRLDELEKKAVAEAVHAWGGDFDAVRFRAKYGKIPDYFVNRSYGYRSSRPPPYRGSMPLFFYDGTIPGDLRELLAAFVSAPETDALRTVPEAAIPRLFDFGRKEAEKVPVRRLAMEPVIRHDLPALLHLVDSGQISVSDKTGQAGAAAVRKLEDVLLGGDFYTAEEDRSLDRRQGGPIRPIRPFAWPLLLQAGGLARRNGKKLELTRKGRKALTAPLEETIRDLYERWCAKGMLDEYRRVDLVKGQNGKGRRMTAVSERRMVIGDALEECPSGEWIAINELFRYMQAVGHDFEVAHDYWKLYVMDSQYGSLGYGGCHGFGILQGRYILAYLFEYLATLGLVDLVYTLPYGVRSDYSGMWGTDELEFFSRYDGLLYFRLNPLGAYCLGLEEEYRPVEPESEPLLTLDADLRIALLREAEPGERLLLEQYAEPAAAGGWRMTPEAILKAMEQGRDPELFHTFLRSHAAADLPPAAEQLFEAAGERLSAIADGGPARLLQCASAALAGMIAADPATQAFCLHAGGRTLAVPEKSEKAFRKGLSKLGYIYPRK